MELRDRALIMLMTGSGLRHKEAQLLDTDDIDLTRQTVTIRAATAKFSKARVAVLDDDTADALDRWLRVRPAQSDGACTCSRGEKAALTCPQALFTTMPRRGNRGGTRISYDTLALIVRERGKKAGIDDLHPHVLRHTWASAV